MVAAASAVEVTKVYGKDESEVRALDGVTVEFARAQFTAIMGPSGSGKSKPDREWLDTVIDVMGLRDRLDHGPSEMSGGQQQRVAVGRALATRPQIIFADEPTGNLDSQAGTQVLEFMRTAVDRMSPTIVMVTHDPMSAGYADGIVFLADGRIAPTTPTSRRTSMPRSTSNRPKACREPRHWQP